MFSTKKLTLRQTEILDFLISFRRNHGFMPSFREIADHFRFKSTKAVADHITALEKKGYVRRHQGLSRGIDILSSELYSGSDTISVPILGNIQAGFPENQIQQDLGFLSVDKKILVNTSGNRFFALRVHGDSMDGRGIRDGDMAIANADATAQEREVVVALIDGESTLKTLAKKEEGFYLKAENPKYTDLIPYKEIDIQGVVTAIIRQRP